jgi:hypothetical protein
MKLPYETLVTLRKREYRIVIDERHLWTAYKRNKWSAWEKMPLWTRAQEHNFPKTLAKIAQELAVSTGLKV